MVGGGCRLKRGAAQADGMLQKGAKSALKATGKGRVGGVDHMAQSLQLKAERRKLKNKQRREKSDAKAGGPAGAPPPKHQSQQKDRAKGKGNFKSAKKYKRR